MTSLGNIFIGLGNTIDKIWYRLKKYAYKCRLVYANVFFT